MDTVDPWTTSLSKYQHVDGWQIGCLALLQDDGAIHESKSQ
jgi:hypothetical protein